MGATSMRHCSMGAASSIAVNIASILKEHAVMTIMINDHSLFIG